MHTNFMQLFNQSGQAPFGGITFAWTILEDKKELFVSYALCNKTDLFNKKKGREISEARLKALTSGTSENETAHSFIVPFDVFVYDSDFFRLVTEDGLKVIVENCDYTMITKTGINSFLSILYVNQFLK